MKAVRKISPWRLICFFGFLSIIPFSLNAQCSTQESVTYDTLVVGSGNEPRIFNLPKFDPSIGTLTGTNISSIVSVNYGFTLTNMNATPINFSIGVGRKDNFQSASLSVPYNNSMIADVGTFFVNPDETITQSPTTVINRYDNSVNISSDVVEFIGTGTIAFNYNPRTYTTHSGSSSYQYSATANDTIHFSITYFYCGGVVLSNDLSSFSAVKESNQTVKLIWTTGQEQTGPIYEIQKSIDGQNFSPAGSVAATNNNNNNYTYHYQTSGIEKRNLWFRLRIKDVSGIVKYSPVRAVDMSNASATAMYVYPNPSDQFINIVFNTPISKNWLVDIYAANGALIQQNVFKNKLMAHIDFRNRFSPGTYFLKALDQQTLQIHVLSFIVR